MSDFAAVAESDRFPAKWAAGDAKENELVLSADFGEGTFLSGSVWESAEGDEKPWHCIFRFSQEDIPALTTVWRYFSMQTVFAARHPRLCRLPASRCTRECSASRQHRTPLPGFRR